MDFSQLKFDANGLIPAIAQDARTNQVLMLAYMNEQSIEQTLETGYATYFSRSRQALWKKGETSGHTQKLVAMRYDCDHDAMLLTVEQVGPACHTGAKSCFFNDVYVDEDAPATANVLQEDYATIADRAANPVEGSYTNYLLDNGVEKICKKVGEEASETIIAAMKANKRHVASRDGEALEILLSLLDPDFQGKFLPARTEVKVLHHASDAFPVAVVNLGAPPCRRIAGKTDTPAEPYPVRKGAGTVRASSYKAAHRLRIYPSLVRVAPEWKSSASGA